MIKDLKLVNFRNFDSKELKDFEAENFIIWENWKWKTNILEAISLIWNNSITKLHLDDLVKLWEDYFFVEIIDQINNKYWFYYSKKDKKKNFLINNKKTTRKNFMNSTYSCVIFSPIMMNMMYLSPSLRRDFLDEAIKSSYPEYELLVRKYKKILKSRNSTLKAINEKRAKIEDLKFFDENFVQLASQIYFYRFKFVNFLKESIINTAPYFSGKIKEINFEYKTKIDEQNIENSIKNYIQKNLNRDIILWKTPIWPHVDDFDILIDWVSLVNFASRWETKSVIIYLKLLEWIFIEKKTGKKPILIIDDLLSELDEEHKDLLISKIRYYQTFISNIFEDPKTNYIKI